MNQIHPVEIRSDAKALVTSLEQHTAIRSVFKDHLASRIVSLNNIKQSTSSLSWLVTRLKLHQSLEHLLYWKLVHASQVTSIDQYSLQLAYYHMEYQVKRYVSNEKKNCVRPVMVGNCSCTICSHECSWVDEQSEWSTRFIRERSVPSEKHWLMDALWYVVTASFIGWMVLLSSVPCCKHLLNSTCLRVVQELSYHSLGYVFSTQSIEKRLTAWYNRIAFGIMCITFQFVVLILMPLVQLRWVFTNGFVRTEYPGNNAVEPWLVPALCCLNAIFLAIILAILPTNEETSERSRYMSGMTNNILMKVQRYQTSPESNESRSLLVSANTSTSQEILLYLVNRETYDQTGDMKRLWMALMALIVACTGPLISQNEDMAPFGACSEGCGIWPTEFFIFTKAIRLPLVVVMFYSLESMMMAGLPYIWRKRTIHKGYLQLLEGCKNVWRNQDKVVELRILGEHAPKKASTDKYEEHLILDMTDNNTLTGFSMIVKLLESHDSTEKRRAEAVIGGQVVGMLTLVAFTVFCLVTRTGSLGVRFMMQGWDTWTLNWWTIELFVIVSFDLVFHVLISGVQINNVPAELHLLMTDCMFWMAQTRSTCADQKSPEELGAQKSHDDAMHTLGHLMENFKTVVFGSPFSLLGIELTIGRAVTLGLSAGTTAVTMIATVFDRYA